MTPEELLKPRYKVIADYPQNLDKVGDIFEVNKIGWADSDKYFDKYPHLFKKLEWWEERMPEEMPMYLKDECRNQIVIVLDYYEDNCFDSKKTDGSTKIYHIGRFAPATEEEYLKQNSAIAEK